MGLGFRAARKGSDEEEHRNYHRFEGLFGLVLRASEMEKRIEATRVCSLNVGATTGCLNKDTILWYIVHHGFPCCSYYISMKSPPHWGLPFCSCS